MDELNEEEEILIDNEGEIERLVDLDSGIVLTAEQLLEQSSIETVTVNETTQHLIDNLSWKYFSTRGQLERTREILDIMRSTDRQTRLAKVTMFEEFHNFGSAPTLEAYIARDVKIEDTKNENEGKEHGNLSNDDESITKDPRKQNDAGAEKQPEVETIDIKKQLNFLETTKEALVNELQRERELKNELYQEHKRTLTSLGSCLFHLRQENRLLEIDYDELDRINVEQELECDHLEDVIEDLEKRNQRLEHALIDASRQGSNIQEQTKQSGQILMDKVEKGLQLAQKLKGMSGRLRSIGNINPNGKSD